MKKLVTFKVHISSQGKIHVPKAIRNEFNCDTLEILGGIKTIIVYPRDAELEDVLSSLLLIKKDLEQRIDLEHRHSSKNPSNQTI